MRTAAVAFVSATLAGAVLTPAVRALAYRWGLLDHALTSRKVHGKPVPRLGGVAIVLAFFAPLLALLFVNTGVGHQFLADPFKAFGLFAGGLGIAALGVWDDLKGANARTKFLVQFAVAGAMYALGYRIDILTNPFGAPLHLGWIGLPFTVLWIAGVINAMNLIDGLDGLAGGVAFIAVATIFVIALVGAQPLMILFTAALAGAVLGFLFYNFNPATIFMGDTGSMFLGFVLATTAIQTNQKSATAVAIVVPILALGVPIADTLLAMLRRYARGVPMFSADRGHIHHRLLGMGLSQRQTVLIIYAASAVLGAAALVLSFASSKVAAIALVILGAMAFVALRKLGFLNLARAREALGDRRRNLELRASVRTAGAALGKAASLDDAWTALRVAAEGLGAAAVALSVALPGGARRDFAEGFDGADGELLRARYGLVMERPDDDTVELGWSDGRTEVDRDTEIAVELLCDHLSTSVERLLRDAEKPSKSWPGLSRP
jgi:UDP-GlcNAc:undecaprenyl-phosphate GlcNAc-1-phosphate transferase